MKLLVGLGNPGPKYVTTRHNFGFLLLDTVSQQLEAHDSWTLDKDVEIPKLGRWQQFSSQTDVCHLLWPLTYMNLSGHAVSNLLGVVADEEFDTRDNILVAIDDLSLPLGRARFRSKGSSGGHNGLKSVEEHLGHKEYARVKLGIGRPDMDDSVVDFVLQPFSVEDMSTVEQVLEYVAPKTIEWLSGTTLGQLSQSVNGWQATIQSSDEVLTTPERGTTVE